MIELLVKGWYEPVRVRGLHASTLVQQVLSSIAQYGGLTAARLWDLLFDSGPFQNVGKDHFLNLLRALGKHEILLQDPTGLLHLAVNGERIVEHYSFYAAFNSSEEYRIVTAGKSIGSMPVSRPLQVGNLIIFAGRRWQVVSVFPDDLLIEVTPARAGVAPNFEGILGAKIHDRVRDMMLEVLSSRSPFPFLDASALRLLEESRDSFHRLGLGDRRMIQIGATTHLMTWKGDWANDTLQVLLVTEGLKALNEGISITVQDADPARVRAALQNILNHPPESEEAMASDVVNMPTEKWDKLLPHSLLAASYASSNFDLQAALMTASEIVRS